MIYGIVTNFSHACSLLFARHSFVVEDTHSFMIYEHKFGWVKLWQIAPDLLNLPKFSPATLLRYTAYKYIYMHEQE